jgi:tetratricopeptide (TPR) repeat protein
MKANGMPLGKSGLKYIFSISLLLMIISGCATRYEVRSYPEGATVFIRDVITQEKKLVGTTPLTLKKTRELGDVFFITVEKDDFFPKSVLMTPKENRNMMVELSLDPMEERNRLAQQQKEEEGQQQQQPQDPKKEEEEKEVDDLKMRLALLENTISMYKDALFSNRFSAGPASFDRDRTDRVIDHLFKAQQLVMQKELPGALAELDKVLLIDEYVAQAHLMKGTIYYMSENFEMAQSSWQRALKIDPHNAQVYHYLQVVSQKTGGPQPPSRPSMLRAPATDAFSRGLRE